MPDFTELLSNPWVLLGIGVALYLLKSPIANKAPDWLQPVLATLEKLLERLQDKPVVTPAQSESPADDDPDEDYPLAVMAQSFYSAAVAEGNADVAKCIREHILPTFEAQ